MLQAHPFKMQERNMKNAAPRTTLRELWPIEVDVTPTRTGDGAQFGNGK